MTDYSTFRAEMEWFVKWGDKKIQMSPQVMIDLLDEIDALRAQIKPAKPVRNDYPPAFDEAWAAYPPRENANKRKAFSAWSARIKEKVAPADILAGVDRYAAHVLAERKEERYTLQPATFFGPDEYFKMAWASQSAQTSQLGKAGQATADAAREWLKGRGNG